MSLTAPKGINIQCPRCQSGQWVGTPRLSLLDRWRLWRDTGHPPWTRHIPDPELYG
jgi:hypothetical protein